MLEYYLKGMLGAWGSPALDFIRDHPTVVAAVLLVWLGFVAAGRWQLWRIRQESVKLVVAAAHELTATTPHLTSRELYERIYILWSERVGRWAWFVPHRLGLWPAPVTAQTVQQKFSFSPEWVAEVLRQHEIKLKEDGKHIQAH
ncbi:MAG: hypothetical protein L6R45_28670 [Anaerolineae bacterium]|nr:hypothetical protein [Anaerolineae bacterium]